MSIFLLASFTLKLSEIKELEIKTQIKPILEKQGKPGNCTTPVEVDPEEAYYFIIEKKPLIIDVRTQEEYKTERLCNVSYNIDFYSPDFKDRLNQLDKNQNYLIYCRTGRRSAQTLEIMKELGFRNIHHIKGGISAWKEKGYPTCKD
ncbi:MAG: rhodanese-like domain-containing protein [Elusimicrobiota bacterium]